METALSVYALKKDEGKPISFLGTQTFVKATGEQTAGAFGLVEHVIPAGGSSPYHIHHNEEEIFYVLEGEVTFVSGDKVINATPGTYVFLPPKIAHGFRAETAARVLLQTIPAGFEQFVLEMSEPAPESGSAPAGPVNMEKMMKLADKYKLEILGPLPETQLVHNN